MRSADVGYACSCRAPVRRQTPPWSRMGCGSSTSSQGVTAPQPSKPGPVFEQPSKPGPVLELPSKAAPAKPAPAETSPTKQVAAPSKPAPTPHAKVDPVKPAAATAASTSLDVMASAAQHGAQSPRFIRVEAESTEYGTKLFAGEIADKVAIPRAPRAPLTLSQCALLLCRNFHRFPCPVSCKVRRVGGSAQELGVDKGCCQSRQGYEYASG